MKHTNTIYERIRSILEIQKVNPLLPIWGELFSVIWEIKKSGKLNKQTMFLYSLENAEVIYDFKEDLIMVKTSYTNIKMKDFEYINSLLEGRFI